MQHHSAWHLLFHNPDFWDLLTKQHLCCLRTTCREFHTRVPEREALLRVIRSACMRKADLFRLLPLTVYDVLRMRSPVRFTDALLIAERKSKGFEACLAIVRDKGWRLWCERGRHRAECKQQIQDALLAQSDGVSAALLPLDHPVLHKAAASGHVARVIYWHCVDEGPAVSFQRCYRRFLTTIKHAYGYWYKGIHADTLAVTRVVVSAREAAAAHCVHLTFAHDILAMGVVSLQH